jgi:glycosyltransferase involved in cell wall biosynthesis
MILGIDASNIRQGGGVTHLVELLRGVDPLVHGFSQVVVWSGASTLDRIEQRQWLCKVHDPLFESGLAYRLFWQKFKLKKLARQAGCDLLFVPGGSDASNFQPLVTMSQNMLPFEWRELKRFGLSLMTVKLLLLRLTQSKTFRKADGVIFLTKYAHDGIQQVTGKLAGKTINIPHGINSNFFSSPRSQRDSAEFTMDQPCRLIYVSIIDAYKHQWQVVNAVGKLRESGIPVILDLIGPPGAAIDRLEEAIKQVDPEKVFIKYHGAVEYDLLPTLYKSADIGIFASSCENMPNILLESMAAGLPIACSNMGPMPEILCEAGVYFNPEQPEEIATAIRDLIISSDLRKDLAKLSFQKAQLYSWDRCAMETFEFLAQIAKDNCLLTDTSIS